MYKGTIIRNETVDPEYKVLFSFDNGICKIEKGVAIFIRKSPTPKVVFDDYTDYLLEKIDMDDETIRTIKLEVGKTVCDFIFSSMDYKKVSRK